MQTFISPSVQSLVYNAPSSTRLSRQSYYYVEGVRRIPFVDSALNKAIGTNGAVNELPLPFHIRSERLFLTSYLIPLSFEATDFLRDDGEQEPTSVICDFVRGDFFEFQIMSE